MPDPAHVADIVLADMADAEGVQFQRQVQCNTLGVSCHAFLDTGVA